MAFRISSAVIQSETKKAFWVEVKDEREIEATGKELCIPKSVIVGGDARRVGESGCIDVKEFYAEDYFNLETGELL